MRSAVSKQKAQGSFGVLTLSRKLTEKSCQGDEGIDRILDQLCENKNQELSENFPKAGGLKQAENEALWHNQVLGGREPLEENKGAV